MESMTFNKRPPGEVIRQFTEHPPVNVEGLAKALGLSVWEKELPRNSGMLTADHLSGPSGYTIYVNSTDALYRRRFTIAHEIAHYLLHRNRETREFMDDRMYRSPGISDAKEAEANRLAADILMPRRIIRRLLDEGITDPQQMASRLMVSPDAMEIRLGLRSKFGQKRANSF
jgi:Zn-dependent peptidase ImmA (M78 family)